MILPFATVKVFQMLRIIAVNQRISSATRTVSAAVVESFPWFKSWLKKAEIDAVIIFIILSLGLNVEKVESFSVLVAEINFPNFQ